jgi:hypothetical protein
MEIEFDPVLSDRDVTLYRAGCAAGFAAGYAQAKREFEKPKCEHVMTRYIRDCSMCESCGAILTDGSWGAQSGKWFRSYTEALQEHNR